MKDLLRAGTWSRDGGSESRMTRVKLGHVHTRSSVSASMGQSGLDST